MRRRNIHAPLRPPEPPTANRLAFHARLSFTKCATLLHCEFIDPTHGYAHSRLGLYRLHGRYDQHFESVEPSDARSPAQHSSQLRSERTCGKPERLAIRSDPRRGAIHESTNH